MLFIGQSGVESMSVALGCLKSWELNRPTGKNEQNELSSAAVGDWP